MRYVVPVYVVYLVNTFYIVSAYQILTFHRLAELLKPDLRTNFNTNFKELKRNFHLVSLLGPAVLFF